MPLPATRSRLSYKDRISHQKKRFRFVRVVLLVLVVYLLISTALAEPWVLNTDSMNPGYPSGVRFLVHPYWLRDKDGNLRFPPKRGDLVSLMPPYIVPEAWYFKVINPVLRLVTFQKIDIGLLSKDDWENSRIFKRIIALPGDTVYLDDSVAYVKGAEDEFFISEFEMSGIGYDLEIHDLPVGWSENLPLSGMMDSIVLGEGQYFVLGDNRSASNDSRYWGPIPVKNIRGKAFFFYWPLHSFGKPQ
ncbi:MAG: signal peptidase I [Spirochaetes bacterium]|nr:MAG: signal peptidase I [Spirochaetota bacterium]RKX96237.1 MAG: signal peptidase I [Spirochaetota bacterium]